MKKEYCAHTKEGRGPEEWQSLADHLLQTSKTAGDFAACFNAREWGELAGLIHDLGKSSQAFQDYLLSTVNSPTKKPSGVDHSTAGAVFIHKKLGDIGKLLAYAVAGHHAGLPNAKDKNNSNLHARLGKEVTYDPAALPAALPQVSTVPISQRQGANGFVCAFFIRMLFSCLVDADFLDTEAFMNEARSEARQGYSTIPELADRFFPKLDALVSKAEQTPVNQKRAQVLEQCLTGAELKPGLFSLTVPTGGGKTLSSLAFALKHAQRYGLNRIIYVIPYTSIIEQNAEVFRKYLGKEEVLEHHSSYDYKDDEDGKEKPHMYRAKLASENWDAPVVVTTNVQFFESLFASRTSRCRKLHNLCKSVIILDEAQMLPPQYLLPCLEALRELTANYGASVVLCTATQPALTRHEQFPKGLEQDAVRELIKEPLKLYESLKRVKTQNLGPLSDDELAARLKGHNRVLCIVNLRKHARELFERLGSGEGNYHLSAAMYPEHRSRKLEEIRKRLDGGLECRVISTSLIEAGVDVDFPVVYRAQAGIDSIAQAAGRCNREGRLEMGKLYVFEPTQAVIPAPCDDEDESCLMDEGKVEHKKRPIPSYLKQSAQKGAEVIRLFNDILGPDAVEKYFQLLYWMAGADLDKKGILLDIEESASRGDFPFRETSRKFCIIDTPTESLIIPWTDEAATLVESLRHAEFPSGILRKLQRYTVQVYQQEMATLRAAGVVETINEVYFALGNMDIYSNDFGLVAEEPTYMDTNSTIR